MRDEAAADEVAAFALSRFGQLNILINAALIAFIVSPAGCLFQGALPDMDGGQTKTLRLSFPHCRPTKILARLGTTPAGVAS